MGITGLHKILDMTENLALGILFLFSSCVSAQGTDLDGLSKEELHSIMGTYALWELGPN